MEGDLQERETPGLRAALGILYGPGGSYMCAGGAYGFYTPLWILHAPYGSYTPSREALYILRGDLWILYGCAGAPYTLRGALWMLYGPGGGLPVDPIHHQGSPISPWGGPVDSICLCGSYMPIGGVALYTLRVHPMDSICLYGSYMAWGRLPIQLQGGLRAPLYPWGAPMDPIFGGGGPYGSYMPLWTLYGPGGSCRGSYTPSGGSYILSGGPCGSYMPLGGPYGTRGRVFMALGGEGSPYGLHTSRFAEVSGVSARPSTRPLTKSAFISPDSQLKTRCVPSPPIKSVHSAPPPRPRRGPSVPPAPH